MFSRNFSSYILFKSWLWLIFLVFSQLLNYSTTTFQSTFSRICISQLLIEILMMILIWRFDGVNIFSWNSPFHRGSYISRMTRVSLISFIGSLMRRKRKLAGWGFSSLSSFLVLRARISGTSGLIVLTKRT